MAYCANRAILRSSYFGSVLYFVWLSLNTYARIQPFFRVPHPISLFTLRHHGRNLTRQRRKLGTPAFDGNDSAFAIQKTFPCLSDTCRL